MPEQGQTGAGYEAAPGTALVDQRCVACGRALLDAASVAAGMGPDCRERYGVQAPLTGEQRWVANRAVYLLAAADHGGQDAPVLLASLRAIGFVELCDRIEERRVKVTIRAHRLAEGSPEVLLVDFPGADPSGWAAASKSIPGLLRREESIDGEKRSILIVGQGKPARALWEALARCLPGELGRGRRGLFVFPSEASPAKGQRAA